MKKFKELKKNMSIAALEAAEELYLELEKELDGALSSDEDEIPTERYSECSCSSCGARLTLDEFDLYEDACYSCITDDTCGIINDNPIKEL